MTNFDNVIADLRWIISIHETADFASIEEIERAIRVLEAAGKVDKKKAMKSLREAIEDGEHDTEGHRDAQALVAALPDPAAKKKEE